MTGEPTGTRLLNDYSEITIKGTKYKIHSIFEGEKSFQSLLEDLIVTKAAQQKNDQNHKESLSFSCPLAQLGTPFLSAGS